MARRKWNSSNPLYRWLKRKGRLKGQRKKAKRSGGKAYSRGVRHMARRRYSRSRSRRGGFNMKRYLMLGLVGLGGAAVASKFGMSTDPKLSGAVIGGLLGGLPGAAAGYVTPLILGGIGSGGMSNGGVFY